MERGISVICHNRVHGFMNENMKWIHCATVEKCGICSFIRYPKNHLYATSILISSTVLLSDGNPYKCYINTILNITTGSMLGLPLSAQYKSSTMS